MVETYSPTGHESKISSLVKITMDDIGYSTSVDKVGNIIGQIGSGKPIILLCGHLDTITPELPTHIEDGILYGRGAVDAKSPLAAMIIAGKLAHDRRYPGTIYVVGAVSEEGDNLGILTIIEAKLKADYGVFGEPTNTRAISIGYRGCMVAEVTMNNESGHSSAPWAYPNAIEKSVEFYNYLKEEAKNQGDASTGFDSLSISLREIKGGENIGVIPRHCKMIIELRLPPKIDAKKCRVWFENKVRYYVGENNAEDITYKIIDEIDPYITDKKNLLVKAFSQTIYKKFGDAVALLKKTGTSDMNYYGKAFKVPVITYGPGESRLSHTDKEKVLINDYLTSIEILTDSILRVAELYNINKS